jgi:hypothetical protein
MRFKILITLSIFLSVSTPIFASEDIKRIGSFDNVKSNTGEHCYGYSVSLWETDDSVVGLLNHHAGLCGDPQCSIITGEIDNSNLTFTAAQPIYGVSYTYEGVIEKDSLEGTLNGSNLTMEANEYPAGSYQSLEKWCEFWSTVSRCVGVKEFCKQAGN